MARVRPPLPIFFAFLTLGSILFINRKKLMPDVYEKRKVMRDDSFVQAATAREAFKRRKEAKEDH